jgi:hypothetical protein
VPEAPEVMKGDTAQLRSNLSISLNQIMTARNIWHPGIENTLIANKHLQLLQTYKHLYCWPDGSSVFESFI